MKWTKYINYRLVDILFFTAVLLSNQSIYAKVFMYFILTLMTVVVIAEVSGVELVDPTPMGYNNIQKALNHAIWIITCLTLLYKCLYFELAVYAVTYLIVNMKVRRYNKCQ